MKIFSPHYYCDFVCLAGSCPDSCCKEWDVTVDTESASRYLALEGPLGDRLRQALVPENGEYTLRQGQDRRCPMWQPDGLCAIQAALGEEGLCSVCHQFPRLRHDYGDFVELGLELSCPEAARLILNTSDVIWQVQENSQYGEKDYDGDTMQMLLVSREQVRELIRSGRYTVGELLAILLLYSYDMDEALQDPAWMPESLDAEKYLHTCRELARPGSMEEILEYYKSLEILNPRWLNLLASGTGEIRWQEQMRPLIRYFVDRYWLQAISDEDLASRAKFIVLSCLVIASLDGALEYTAQQYSKEIENDADNVNTILDDAFITPAFADTGLLGLLL